MTIDFDRAVLLPIDMQRAFDASPWPRRWNDQVDENGLALLSKWRETGRPIIHIRHDSVMEGSSLAPGTDGNRFRSGFEPLAGEPLVAEVCVSPNASRRWKSVSPSTIVSAQRE